MNLSQIIINTFYDNWGHPTAVKQWPVAEYVVWEAKLKEINAELARGNYTKAIRLLKP